MTHIEEIRRRVREQLAFLSPEIKQIEHPQKYPVPARPASLRNQGQTRACSARKPLMNGPRAIQKNPWHE